jgi:replicative DNA helicase
VNQISEKPFVRPEIPNQIGEEPYSINGYGNENQHSQVVSYGKESSLINAEPDVIKVIKQNVAFTSTEFDKSIINKLKDKGVTYAIFFDEKKQNEFHSLQLSQDKKIHSNLINTISKNADKQETLEEILCFYENEILYIENNPNFIDLKIN